MTDAAATAGLLAPIEARREKLSDTALRRLIDLLTGGGLQPGDTLPSETELARAFGVSKPVVREAIHRLVTMGVVEVRQGRPTTIRAVTAAPLALFLRLAMRASATGLLEAIELRTALETQITALAAQRISDTEIATLRATFDEMTRMRDQLDGWVEADVRFHLILARAAGNTLIGLLIEALRDTMAETIRTLHAERGLRDPNATLRRHRAILDAVSARDPEAARLAMAAHFDATRPVVQALLARQGRR